MQPRPFSLSTTCAALGGAAASVALALACGGSTSSSDAGSDAGVASCLVTDDGGSWTYVSCIDFVGSATPDIAMQFCKAMGAAGTATYRPTQPCPTDGRVGSCSQGQGTPAEVVLRCYPPLAAADCRRSCEAFDGGFAPN